MYSLLIPTLFLAIFGFFNILGIKSTSLVNQLVFFLIGIGCFGLFRIIGRNFLRINSRLSYFIFLTILVITYVIGVEVKGSKRWIDLYFFNFQASEFFKIFFIYFLAHFLSRYQSKIKRPVVFLKALIYFTIPTVIIFKQPDLGTALVFFGIFVMMMAFSGVPSRYLFYFFLALFMITPLSWFFLKGYQKLRLLSFISPHLDRSGTAYNMIQAVITVGSGKLFGHGLGLGTQSRLFFLPENHTDFAFSSLVEQFGFVGGAIVIILYGIIAYVLVKKLLHYFYNQSHGGFFSYLYLVGFFTYFIFQVTVNIGMNLGLLPVAGIALPLISYGGSSLVTWMIGLALIP